MATKKRAKRAKRAPKPKKAPVKASKASAKVAVENFAGQSTPDPKPKRKGSLSRATAMRLVACDTCGEKFLPERGFRTGRKYRHLPNWRSTTCKKCEDKAK